MKKSDEGLIGVRKLSVGMC